MIDPDTDEQLSGYVQELFAREGALEELRHEISRRGVPDIYISAEVGRLLQVLLASVGARRVLEIGTLGGYSALWMARALPADGTLVTLELDPERAELAREFIRREGREGVVEVRVGDAREILPELVGQVEAGDVAPFDAVFIDADKEPYPDYLKWSLGIVRPGGLILADNAFRDGRVLDDDPDADTRGVLDYNERAATDPRLISTVIPIRDGLVVSVVKP